MEASAADVEQVLAGLRRICAGFPEVTERLSHGSPAWFVRQKSSLAMFVNDHHGDGILGIWCKAPPGVQEELVAQEPGRFFRPPYVGPSGWIGVRLDTDVDWEEIAGILTDAFRCAAPKRLLAQFDG
jgi:hypothetical protein